MEEKIFWEIFEKHGLPGILIAVWLYGRFKVWWKKNVSKNFTSYEDIREAKEDIKLLRLDLDRVRENCARHEIERERNMEAIQSKLQHTENRMDELGYIVRDISGSLKTNNRIMGEVKDFLEKWEEKK